VFKDTVPHDKVVLLMVLPLPLQVTQLKTQKTCMTLVNKNYKVKTFKGKLSDSFTNYNYVGNTKVSVSIKKT